MLLDFVPCWRCWTRTDWKRSVTSCWHLSPVVKRHKSNVEVFQSVVVIDSVLSLMQASYHVCWAEKVNLSLAKRFSLVLVRFVPPLRLTHTRVNYAVCLWTYYFFAEHSIISWWLKFSCITNSSRSTKITRTANFTSKVVLNAFLFPLKANCRSGVNTFIERMKERLMNITLDK